MGSNFKDNSLHWSWKNRYIFVWLWNRTLFCFPQKKTKNKRTNQSLCYAPQIIIMINKCEWRRDTRDSHSTLPFDCFPFFPERPIPISWAWKTQLPICTYTHFSVSFSLFFGNHQINTCFGFSRLGEFSHSLEEEIWTLWLHTRNYREFSVLEQGLLRFFSSPFPVSGLLWNILSNNNWCWKGIA